MRNNTQMPLREVLAQAALELREEHPPATLLPAIHRSLAAQRAGRKAATRRFGGWVSWAGLSTACVAVAAAAVVVLMPEETAANAPADNNGYIAVATSDAWQRAAGAGGRAWLVTTEIPQSRLAALGLPYDPAHAGERLPAQLLMQGSGDVLAVRMQR